MAWNEMTDCLTIDCNCDKNTGAISQNCFDIVAERMADFIMNANFLNEKVYEDAYIKAMEL